MRETRNMQDPQSSKSCQLVSLTLREFLVTFLRPS
jgi:hypothetical protein